MESQGPVATGQSMFLAHGQNTQASATLPGQTRKRVSQFVPADHFRYMSHGGMLEEEICPKYQQSFVLGCCFC